MALTVADLRRMTLAHSIFPPTTLKRALNRLQFVQADPIRAPARAQDLILRHRVTDYRVGDLERRYAKLGIEEDFFINYGFVTRKMQALMHPRTDAGVPAAGCLPWPAAQRKRARLLLDFVRRRGSVHPREVDEYFSHGTVKNYWGGSSNATTHLLDAMHYQGLLRIVRREAGIRIYAARVHPSLNLDDASCEARVDALADAAIGIYAPLPLGSLRFLLRRLRFAVPQWEDRIRAAIHRARERLSHAEADGTEWYWPSDWKMHGGEPDDRVRLLAPFDPIVWDRWRFERLWGWTYRFEAYTPVAKRVRGYYAMPMLWRDQVIGWGNLSVTNGSLKGKFGYVKGEPPETVFPEELEAELERIRKFLGIAS